MIIRLYNARSAALFLAVLLLLTFTAFGSLPVFAGYESELEQLEQEKAQLRDEKNAAGQAAANLREKKAAWVEQKESLDEKNRLAQEEILNTQKQIEIYNTMIAEKQAEADAAQTYADETLTKYKKRLRAMEENGQFNTYMGVLVGAQDFDELLSRVDMITEIMENDRRIEQEYEAARDAALVIKEEYEQLNRELESKKAELEAEVKKLEEEIAEADKMIAEIQQDIDKYTALYNRAATSESSVRNRISTILAIMRAAEEAAKWQETPDGGTESAAPVTPTTTGTGSYIWPVPSNHLVTSLYGNRLHPELGYVRFHSGIDIDANVGTPIVAADSGTVMLVGYEADGYGNYVVINHGSGKTTLYAHMNSVGVSEGESVQQGQTIAYAGSTGLSTGPHLHFEVQYNGGTSNPLNYFSGYTIWEEAY